MGGRYLPPRSGSGAGSADLRRTNSRDRRLTASTNGTCGRPLRGRHGRAATGKEFAMAKDGDSKKKKKKAVTADLGGVKIKVKAGKGKGDKPGKAKKSSSPGALDAIAKL